jgi:hypothetical protein
MIRWGKLVARSKQLGLDFVSDEKRFILTVLILFRHSVSFWHPSWLITNAYVFERPFTLPNLVASA